MPTQEELCRTFTYQDGQLYWAICAGRKHIGDTAGVRQIRINKTLYLAHRLIWVMHNGAIPPDLEIDHIDHDPGNNRIENLRAVSHVENLHNLGRAQKNTSGFNGVYVDRQTGKWRMHFKSKIDGNYISVSKTGFDSAEKAYALRRQLEAQYGFHPNHGQVV